MGLFGGCGNDNSNWVWIIIVVVFVLCCCGDGNFLGYGNNNCCDPCRDNDNCC